MVDSIFQSIATKEAEIQRIKSKSCLSIGSGTNSRSFTSSDDLFVTGDLEVDGTAWLEGAAVINVDSASALRIRRSDTTLGSLGAYADDGARINTYSQANNNIIITLTSNTNNDHDHDTLSTDPTLFIHSATDPDSNNTQWISITHDQTDGVIAVGTGNIKLSNNLECGGYILPFSSADSAAPNSSLYYSTDQSKLVFKDSGGTVRDLW